MRGNLRCHIRLCLALSLPIQLSLLKLSLSCNKLAFLGLYLPVELLVVLAFNRTNSLVAARLQGFGRLLQRRLNLAIPVE